MKLFFLMLTGLAIMWRRRVDSCLPWTVLLVLTCVFLSRVYWITSAGTLRAEQLACLVLFIHFLVDLLRRRAWPRFELLPLLLLALLPLMLTSSLLASSFPWASLKKTLIYFPYLGGFIALCYFLDSDKKLASAWDFLIHFGTGMIAVSLVGYFLFMSGFDLGMVRIHGGVIWLRGSLVNPNIFGAAAGIVFISMLARSLTVAETTKWSSVFILGALVVSSASLVASFSRTPWILAALAAAATFFYKRRQRKNWLPVISTLLLSILAAGVISIVGSKAYNSRMNLASSQAKKNNSALILKSQGEFGEMTLDSFVNSAEASFVPTNTPFQQRLRYDFSSIRWRFTVLIHALSDWMKSPIIGRGTDSLMLKHPGIDKQLYYIPITWVAILHDWGIIALVLYAVFLLLVGFRLLRRLGRPGAAGSLIPAIFFVFLMQTLGNQVSTTLQLGSFWIMAAIFSVAAGRQAAPATPGGARPLRIGFDAKWFFSDNASCRVMVRNMLSAMISRKGDVELFILLRRRDRHRGFPFHGPGIHPVYVAGRPTCWPT